MYIYIYVKSAIFHCLVWLQKGIRNENAPRQISGTIWGHLRDVPSKGQDYMGRLTISTCLLCISWMIMDAKNIVQSFGIQCSNVAKNIVQSFDIQCSNVANHIVQSFDIQCSNVAKNIVQSFGIQCSNVAKKYCSELWYSMFKCCKKYCSELWYSMFKSWNFDEFWCYGSPKECQKQTFMAAQQLPGWQTLSELGHFQDPPRFVLLAGIPVAALVWLSAPFLGMTWKDSNRKLLKYHTQVVHPPKLVSPPMFRNSRK